MEYFPNVKKINFEGPDSKNPLAFRHYNPDLIIDGKPLKDHLRFAVACWHTFNAKGSDPFGSNTMFRPWDTSDPIESTKKRADASFEFFQKLGNPYYCFHDADICYEGNSLSESNKNLDEIVKILKEYQNSTGIKLLWNTVNAFGHHRFVHGAATSPNADVFAFAAAKVKKGLEVAKELGAENYVFWGGREGYESLLNTNYKLEMENQAKFYHMALDYANEIGFEGQFLIEPKPKEPTTHQYDYDVATSIAFLKSYNLDKSFKFNIEANHATLAGHTFEHELRVARTYGMLGSIDANQGDPLLGWDTDEFPTDLYSATLAMYEIIENGGLHSGGLNFDSKVRRSSFDLEDLFIAHIAGMDTFARGFLAAKKLKDDNFFENIINQRYESYTNGIGLEILNGTTDFKKLEEYALKNNNITNKSSHLEYVKSMLNEYIF